MSERLQDEHEALRSSTAKMLNLDVDNLTAAQSVRLDRCCVLRLLVSDLRGNQLRGARRAEPPQPPGFNNRLSANWKLLLQIAQHAGGGWPAQARRSAIYLSRTPYEPSIGVQLLAALRAMFAKNRTQVTSEQVVQELLADPDSQWHEYRGRGPITKNQVAALLKDFEIRPVVVHPTKRADLSRHGYRAAQFEEAFARFLPPEPNIRTLKRRGGET